MKPSFALYITILQKQFKQFCQKELQKHHLTQGQLFFLLYIGKHPQCSPKELASQLQLDSGHTTRALTKLENHQWIVQEVNPRDKRARLLSLTQKGQEIFQLSHDFFYQWDQMILKDLSSQEAELLMTLLNKMVISK